jgi:hypothetical protein
MGNPFLLVSFSFGQVAKYNYFGFRAQDPVYLYASMSKTPHPYLLLTVMLLTGSVSHFGKKHLIITKFFEL